MEGINNYDEQIERMYHPENFENTFDEEDPERDRVIIPTKRKVFWQNMDPKKFAEYIHEKASGKFYFEDDQPTN